MTLVAQNKDGHSIGSKHERGTAAQFICILRARRFESEGDDFLRLTKAEIEIWVHDFQLEIHRASESGDILPYESHKSSTLVLPTGELALTLFWDRKNIILESWRRRTNVNSEAYYDLYV